MDLKFYDQNCNQYLITSTNKSTPKKIVPTSLTHISKDLEHGRCFKNTLPCFTTFGFSLNLNYNYDKNYRIRWSTMNQTTAENTNKQYLPEH